MQLMRRQEWNPFRDLESLSTRLNRLFELTRFDGDFEESAVPTDFTPSCDIVETDKDYRVRAELPDVKKENVHVNLEKGILTLQGDRKEEKEERGLRFHRREVSYGHFYRRFMLPEDIDEARIDATFKDGMLEVVVQKAKGKETKAKEIAVH